MKYMFKDDLGRLLRIENCRLIIIVLGIIYTVILLYKIKNIDKNDDLIGIGLKSIIKNAIHGLVGLMVLFAIQEYIIAEYNRLFIFNLFYTIICVLFIICVIVSVAKRAPRMAIIFLPIILAMLSLTSYKFGINVVQNIDKHINYPISEKAGLIISQDENSYVLAGGDKKTTVPKEIGYPSFQFSQVVISKKEPSRIELDVINIKLVSKKNILGKVAGFFTYTSKAGIMKEYKIYIKPQQLSTDQKKVDEYIAVMKELKTRKPIIIQDSKI